MSPRADRYRQRAAEAKDRAAQAQNPSINSAFENVAAGWIACGSALETDRLAVGAILDDNRPSADTFGILVFYNSPNQRAEIQMIGL
jgi:hypothetical protein